jgi:hypothetical protein
VPAGIASKARISVTVRLGYGPLRLTRTSPAVGVAKSPAKVVVRKSGRWVSVTVTAPGVSRPTGWVRVRHGNVVKKVRLRRAGPGLAQGLAKVKVRPGKWKVTVAYGGNAKVKAKTAKARTWRFQ